MPVWRHYPYLVVSLLLGLASLACARVSLNGPSLVAVGSSGVNPYIDDEDRRIAGIASKKVEKYCKDGQRQVDLSAVRSQRKEDLNAIAGNSILDVLEQATSHEDLVEVAKKNIDFARYARSAAPLFVACFLLLVWVLLWFTVCPCFRCVPARERSIHCCKKMLAVVLVVVLLLGISISDGMVFVGYKSAASGLDNVACTSSEFMNATLSGNAEPAFIGVLPLLDQFWHLEQILDDNSDFLKDLRGALDSTEDISASVGLAAQTLKLLAAMLEEPANKQPRISMVGGDSQPGFHTCVISEYTKGALSAAVDALDNGVGAALANARDGVDKELTASKRAQLRLSLREATAPLIEAKKSIQEGFGQFVEDNTVFDDGMKLVDTWGRKAIYSVVIAAGVLVAFGCWTMLTLLCCERTPLSEARGNPYNPMLQRCALFTWCCGFVYAILVFTAAGVLMAASTPLSEVCQISTDLTGSTLIKIAPALDIDPKDIKNASSNFNTVARILDKCVNPSNLSSNANLLDLLYIPSGSGTESLRTQLSQQVQKPIEAMFEQLSKVLAMPLPKLAAEPGVTQLRKNLTGTPIDSLYVFDSEVMGSDMKDEFSALVADPRGQDDIYLGVQIAAVTTLRCSNHPRGQDKGLGGLVGINAFAEKLQFFGNLDVPGPGDGGCARKITNCDANPQTAPICKAGNNYMDLKKRLIQSTSYRCDLFESPVGEPECDPLSMTQSGGVWQSDCLDPVTKRAKVKRRNCNLEQFVEYIKDFDQRIEKVLARIDTVVPEVKQTIDVKLRKLVETYVTTPVDTMIEGVRCQFLAETYDGMLDGLCFQGVWGFSSVARSYIFCGCNVVVLIALMYVTWYVAKDNANTWVRPERRWLDERETQMGDRGQRSNSVQPPGMPYGDYR